MKSRTKARSVALQVLYEVDMTGHLPGAVLSQRIEENPMENSLVDFTSQIIFGVYPLFEKLELEHSQPHFPTFYKDTKSTLCFAVSAMNELNYQGKKVVGSAQRKIGNVILQHGSILCGSFHKRIIDYLNLPSEKLEEIKNEIEQTTTELQAILDEKINYQKLSNAIKEGFENHFNVKLEEEIFSETISQVN